MGKNLLPRRYLALSSLDIELTLQLRGRFQLPHRDSCVTFIWFFDSSRKALERRQNLRSHPWEQPRQAKAFFGLPAIITTEGVLNRMGPHIE
jgi:hypothetical protein